MGLREQTVQTEASSLTLKADLESGDDKKLAIAELTSLVGRHVEAQGNRATLAVGNAAPAGAFLAARLAFWSSVRGSDEEDLITQSQLLENTATRPQLAKRAASSPRITFQPSPSIRKKNEYLSHPFHKYKAKFFPRLARSLINIVAPGERGLVLDPFVGSGTTCVEASLMGLESKGFDIDPLSILIARTKANAHKIDYARARSALARFPDYREGKATLDLWRIPAKSDFRLPRFLLARAPRKLPPELVAEIEGEVNVLRDALHETDDELIQDLFRMILSHAISTKISLRWMGTGDDRFALEIASRSILQIFASHSRTVLRNLQTYEKLRQTGIVDSVAAASLEVADATCLPVKDNSIDGIVTSPPYLPAASGRETYLRSRASSLIALNLLTEEAILETERAMLGSILALPKDREDPLPDEVIQLADWMRPQRERKAKAEPTLAYFGALRRALLEMKRVLKPGAKAAVVVSKEHTFWSSGTREVLQRFEMSRAVTELATSSNMGVGLSHVETIDIELPKMDFVARPGAGGKYSESVIILAKL